MFLIPRRIAFLSTLAALWFTSVLAAQNQQRAPRVEGIRFWSFGDVTRVAIETTGDYKLYSESIEKPNRVFFDLTGLAPPTAAQHSMQVIPVGDHRIRQIRVARLSGIKTRIVLDLDSQVEVISSQLVNPDRLMIEIRPKGTSLPSLSAARSVMGSHKVDLAAQNTAVDSDISETAKTKSEKAPVKEEPVKAAPPVVQAAVIPPPAPPLPPVIAAVPNPISSDRSLVRILGLKLGRVVIDAGHGGHDSGTIGPNGLMEKELVLDVALRLGALITKQMGAEVIYTRSSDVFLPLEERTKMANDQKADLFISVHANSSSEPSATGVETYYFNLTSDKNGLDLATRENASADSAISDLNDLLHRAVLQTKKEESREFAQKIQASLCAAAQKSNNHTVDRGVRQAPFVVLIGATMPSILAEIGFVSNPHDEKLLRKTDQRQKIADALFKGVVQYSNSLSHVQMARAGSE
jgi:N-acetylmuramoyl-L-alanine amidase